MVAQTLKALSGVILALLAPAFTLGAESPVFHLADSQVHYRFSSAIAPAVRVPSGATVIADLRDSADGQVDASTVSDELFKLDMGRVHPLTGPVFVETAEPGDTLAVTLLRIEPGKWGWSALFPGFGVLDEDFPEPYLRTFDLGDAGEIRFNDRIRIPMHAFPGLMGVAPATEEMLSTMPPRENGGNLDDPGIVEGTTVYFPVFVDGALFSIGDGHAVQARGEVSGPAVEIPMKVTYRVDVIKGRAPIPEPQYEDATWYAVTSFGPSLDEATKKAVRYMVNYLVAYHELSPEDAYLLCTLAGDLMINELPNKPNVSMTMRIRKDVLGVR